MAQVYIVMDMMFWMKYLIVGYGRRNDLENRKRQAVRELVSRPFTAFNKLLKMNASDTNKSALFRS